MVPSTLRSRKAHQVAAANAAAAATPGSDAVASAFVSASARKPPGAGRSRPPRLPDFARYGMYAQLPDQCHWLLQTFVDARLERDFQLHQATSRIQRLAFVARIAPIISLLFNQVPRLLLHWAAGDVSSISATLRVYVFVVALPSMALALVCRSEYVRRHTEVSDAVATGILWSSLLMLTRKVVQRPDFPGAYLSFAVSVFFVCLGVVRDWKRTLAISSTSYLVLAVLLYRSAQQAAWDAAFAEHIPLNQLSASFVGAVYVLNWVVYVNEKEARNAFLLLRQRLSAQQEQGALARDLASLIQKAGAPIFELDDTLRVREWNGKMSQLTGVPAHEAIGRPLRSFVVDGGGADGKAIGDDEWTEAAALLRAAAEEDDVSSHVSLHFRGVDAEGEFEAAVEILVNATPRRSSVGDGGAGLFVVGQDLTDLRLAEGMRLELASEGAANVARMKLLSQMCHEIRNPMNGIITAAELMGANRDMPPEEQSELLQVIKLGSDVLLFTVNDFLDWLKVDAGKALDVVRTETDVRSLVRNAYSILDIGMAQASNVTLVPCQVDGSVPPLVWTDSSRLTGILLNLLTNATKNSVAGFVSVRASIIRSGEEVRAISWRSGGGVGGKGKDDEKVGVTSTEDTQELPARRGEWHRVIWGCKEQTVMDCSPRSLNEIIRPDCPHLLIEVEDTGRGIPASALEKVFAEYEQGDGEALPIAGPSPKRFGGTGLGLSICKKQISNLSGAIGAVSQEGVGSVFWFSVPIDPPSPETSPGGVAVHSGLLRELSTQGTTTTTTPLTNMVPPPPTMTTKTERSDWGLFALIAEDNKVNQLMSTKLLSKMGIESLVVENGKDAVLAVQDRLQGRGKMFDFILMDVLMPEMNGLEASEAIRKLGSKVKIFAATANALQSDRDDCLAAGMDDYVTKPISLKSLERVVRTIPLPGGGERGGE